MQVIQRMYAGANSWLLLAIPFFMLAGQIMEKGGVTRRLVAFADSIVGFLPGGLSAVNIVVSMFFGGVSGSARGRHLRGGVAADSRHDRTGLQ